MTESTKSTKQDETIGNAPALRDVIGDHSPYGWAAVRTVRANLVSQGFCLPSLKIEGQEKNIGP